MAIKATITGKIEALEVSIKKAKRDSNILFGLGLPSLAGGIFEMQEYMRLARDHHPEPVVALIAGGIVGLFGIGALSASALERNWAKFDEKRVAVLKGVYKLLPNKAD